MPDVSDNFNRPAENPLSNGGKWGACASLAQLKTNGTAALAPTDGTDSVSLWVGDTWANDQFSQAAVNYNTGVGKLTGVIVRGATGVRTYYALHYERSGGFNALRLIKYVNGSYTSLNLTNFTPAANPFTLKLDATGSTLTGYADGVQVLQVTNETSIASGFVGLYDTVNSGDPTGTLDDFVGHSGAVSLAVDRVFPVRSGLGLAINRSFSLESLLGLVADRAFSLRVWQTVWDRVFPLEARGVLAVDRLFPLRGRRNQATDAAFPVVFLREKNVLAVRSVSLRTLQGLAPNAVFPLTSGPFPITLAIDRVVPLRTRLALAVDRTFSVRISSEAGWTAVAPDADAWQKVIPDAAGMAAFQSDAFQSDAFQSGGADTEPWTKGAPGSDGWTKG